MGKREDQPDARSLSEKVSHQIYGPARMIGPFPDSCESLKKALDMQPMSEFQSGIAEALKRRLQGFCYEATLADGVVRVVRLGKRQINEMEIRGVVQYLSRLLLSYARDRDRAVRRPDTLAATMEDVVASLSDFADGFARQGQRDLAKQMREWTAHATTLAAEYRRLRPRLRGGRRATLPEPTVVRRELAALRKWLTPRWDKIRTSRHDRRHWERNVSGALSTINPSVHLTVQQVRRVLWPPATRRSLDTLAVDLLARAYGVTRRAVLYAKK